MLSAVFVVPASAWDWEWGVTVENTTQGAFSEWYEEARLTQRLKTGIWSSGLSQLDHGGSLSFTASAGYTVTDDRAYLFDVDLLRITGRFPQLLGQRSFVQATAGRTRFVDPTGLVLNHVADGGVARLTVPWGRFRLAGAYSGLLLSPSSSIRISQTDYLEQSADSEFFGPRRIIGLFDATFGAATIFTVAQFDLRDDADGDSIDTQYFGLNVAGRVSDSMFAETVLIVSTGQTVVGAAEDSLFSFVFGTGVRWFAEERRFSQASARALVATPFLPLEEDIGINISEYRPITEPTLGLVFNPRLSNLILTEATYSIRPFAGPMRSAADSLRLSAALRGFFRAYKGDSDYLAAMNPDSDALYLGTEVELGLSAVILTDLRLGLRGGAFVPNSGPDGAFAADRAAEWVVRFDLTTTL
ncbi:MAG: hypothetical protein EA403_00205 [Spirochaetaceae bacterium]|nr:MAG: hypothetical protein EA403_00205 [Spirochaetaceae bacterium]